MNTNKKSLFTKNESCPEYLYAAKIIWSESWVNIRYLIQNKQSDVTFNWIKLKYNAHQFLMHFSSIYMEIIVYQYLIYTVCLAFGIKKKREDDPLKALNLSWRPNL